MNREEVRAWETEVESTHRLHTMSLQLLQLWKTCVNTAYSCEQSDALTVLRANQLLAGCDDRTVFHTLPDDAKRNVVRLEARLGAELTNAYKRLLASAEWQFLDWLRGPLSPQVFIDEEDDYWRNVAYGCRLLSTDTPLQFMLDFCERQTPLKYRNTALGLVKDRVRGKAASSLMDQGRTEEATVWLSDVGDLVTWRCHLLTGTQHRAETLGRARYEAYKLGRRSERLEAVGMQLGASALRVEQNAWNHLATQAMGD